MLSLHQYILENTYDDCANLKDYHSGKELFSSASTGKIREKGVKFAYINFDDDGKFEDTDIDKVYDYAMKHIKDETKYD